MNQDRRLWQMYRPVYASLGRSEVDYRITQTRVVRSADMYLLLDTFILQTLLSASRWCYANGHLYKG